MSCSDFLNHLTTTYAHWRTRSRTSLPSMKQNMRWAVSRVIGRVTLCQSHCFNISSL